MRTLIILLLFPAMALAQNESSSEVVSRMKQMVYTLASDSLGGRPSGSEFEQLASEYIVEQLQIAGIRTTLETFQVELENDSSLSCKNIIGFIENGADSSIIIGAHYDHLGQGSGKSRELVKTGIHNGADDNASGVAILIELARWIAVNKTSTRKYNYYFVAFSAHEIGLYGSKDFTESDLFKSLFVKLYLNMDMVGRLDKIENKIRLSYCAQHDELKNIFPNNSTPSINVGLDVDHTTVNDLSSFCDKDVPAISITTGLHQDYHRVSDTPDKLNYNGMEKILDFLKSALFNN